MGVKPVGSRLEQARRHIAELAAARDAAGLVACMDGGWEVAAGRAVDALVGLGGAAEGPLRQALRSDRRFVRGWAAVALGRLGHHDVEDDLLWVLEALPVDRDQPDSFFNVWELAADLLGDWRSPRAVAPLVAALRSQGVHLIDVREQAADSLGAIGDLRAVPALVSVLEALSGRPDGDLDRACLTWHVVNALRDLGGSEAEAAPARWRAGSGD